MNARQFFNLVCRMRTAQKTYFVTRTSRALNESKDLEALVDAEIGRVQDILKAREPAEGDLFTQGNT